MARRRSKSEIIEDAFADLSLDEQRLVLPVLVGLHRQKQRGGAALADISAGNGKGKGAAQQEPPLFQEGEKDGGESSN